MSDYKVLQEQFPFLTLFEYSGEEYLGIVQNVTKNIVSVYLYDCIQTNELKKEFVDLAQVWWWESNRKIPINLFLKKDFSKFDFLLKNFVTKEFALVQGPMTSIQSLNEKRVKRKRIELIRSDI